MSTIGSVFPLTVAYLLETHVINGRRYLLIPAEDEVEVNGFGVRARGTKEN